MSGRRFGGAGFRGMAGLNRMMRGGGMAGLNELAQVYDGRGQGNDVGVEWQGSAGWSRCRTAGFREMAGLNKMMRGR